MGSDDLFHKRKARTARSLARRTAQRSPYARVLIVCEGEKTEPKYFNEIKDFYELNTANIEITGDCGSSPRNVFDHAKQLFHQAGRSGNPFDKVFCVFDKDTWDCYEQVVKEIDVFRPGDVFCAITSVPCFEYWLLLHFNHTSRPYASLPGNSAAAQVINDLKQYIPEYTKAFDQTFFQLVDQLEAAKAHSKRILEQSVRQENDNPSTNVHVLVEYLQDLKR